MRNFCLRSVILSTAFFVLGCSSGNGGSGGTGGTNNQTGGAGGTGGTGGTAGTGGSGGTGGGAQTGGSSGGSTGGASSTGGSGAGGGSAGTGAGGGAKGGNAGGATATGGTGPGGGTGITVQLDKEHQTIEGFGVNTALSGGTIPWDPAFSTNGADGIGLSIVRIGMDENFKASGDFSGAKSRNVKVIGSVWTAPASWKDNNNTSKGGHLLAAHYEEWATKIADFAKAQGLYAMSAQNEPDFASCGSTIGPPCNGDYVTMVYTAKEMVSFVKVLGPKLKAAGVKLIAPEPSEWIHMWSNTSATGSTVATYPNSSDPLKCGCFGNSPTTGCASKCESGDGYDYGHWLAKDATAWAAVDILGTHEYDSQKAEPWPADVDGGKRTKEIWETEVSGVMYWPEQGPSSDIKNGIATAGWIHSALVVGEASAWLWWWYKASSNGDNEGLVTSSFPKRYYVLGNYSKFVRPNSVMVEVTGNSNGDVLLSAYKGTDSSVIVVAINKGTAAATVPISIAGGTAPGSCTPNVTSATDNLKAGTAVPVTGGTLTASLAASTVTTFVCK